MLLQRDKQLHMASSALIVLLTAPFLGIAAGTLLSLFVGSCKELVWDKWLKRGCPDIEDMIADCIGALAGAGVCAIIGVLLGL